MSMQLLCPRELCITPKYRVVFFYSCVLLYCKRKINNFGSFHKTDIYNNFVLIWINANICRQYMYEFLNTVIKFLTNEHFFLQWAMCWSFQRHWLIIIQTWIIRIFPANLASTPYVGHSKIKKSKIASHFSKFCQNKWLHSHFMKNLAMEPSSADS